MDELVDVLDSNGMYLGRVETRENCSKQGLWHKAVCIFIINSKEQVLLQRRSKNKKLWPDMWDVTAGGNVLAGEFGFNAIIRECKEELGIELAKEEITFIGSVISSTKKGDITNNYFNEYYVVNKDVNVKDLILQEDEVSDAKWVDKNEIINRIKNNYDGITDKTGCWDYLVKYYEMTSKDNDVVICKITDKDLGEEPVKMENPRLRQAARGIVIRDDGKIAIFNKSNKNEYKLPGGGIEGDEKPEVAFKREVLEETGCEVEIIDYLGTTEEYKSFDNFKQISYVFVGKVVKDTKQLNVTEKEKEEGAKLLWETPEEGLKLITGCMDKIVASKYESVYNTKFIILRDEKILKKYLKI